MTCQIAFLCVHGDRTVLEEELTIAPKIKSSSLAEHPQYPHCKTEVIDNILELRSYLMIHVLLGNLNL